MFIKEPQGAIKLPTLWNPTIPTSSYLMKRDKNLDLETQSNKSWSLKIYKGPKYEIEDDDKT